MGRFEKEINGLYNSVSSLCTNSSDNKIPILGKVKNEFELFHFDKKLRNIENIILFVSNITCYNSSKFIYYFIV